MKDIFGEYITNKEFNQNTLNNLNGCKLYYDFLSKDEESYLLNIISSLQWDTSLKRRTQSYGYNYSYKKKSIKFTDYKGDIPETLNIIKDKLDFDFNQLMVNEFLPGQGMSYHIDPPLFEDNVLTLSLSSDCVYEFKKGSDKYELLVPQRSLLLLSGDSRYDFEHSIPFRKVDKFNHNRIKRKRRVSMTFRNVII